MRALPSEARDAPGKRMVGVETKYCSDNEIFRSLSGKKSRGRLTVEIISKETSPLPVLMIALQMRSRRWSGSVSSWSLASRVSPPPFSSGTNILLRPNAKAEMQQAASGRGVWRIWRVQLPLDEAWIDSSSFATPQTRCFLRAGLREEADEDEPWDEEADRLEEVPLGGRKSMAVGEENASSMTSAFSASAAERRVALVLRFPSTTTTDHNARATAQKISA